MPFNVAVDDVTLLAEPVLALGDVVPRAEKGFAPKGAPERLVAERVPTLSFTVPEFGAALVVQPEVIVCSSKSCDDVVHHAEYWPEPLE